MRPRPLRRNRSRLRFLALGSALVVSGWMGFQWWTLPTPATLAKSTPKQSALMVARTSEAKDAGRRYRIHHRYVRLDRISPMLQRAVVLSEDQKFWMHDGIDWGETRKAVDQAFQKGQLGRGASTITQQLAKNLYLSNDRSLVRKAKEWILADRIEDALTKKRILELYLNFAEWGPGIFGAEAAAREHFGKSASQLDAGEAAVLTAMLPSPLTRDPVKPSKNLKRRARVVGALMAEVGLVSKREIDERLNELLK